MYLPSESAVWLLISTLIGSYLGFISSRHLDNEKIKKETEMKLRYLIDEYSELLTYYEKNNREERALLERILRSGIRHTLSSSGIKKQDLVSEICEMLGDGWRTIIYSSMGTGTSNEEVMNGIMDKKCYDDYPKIKEFMNGTGRTAHKRDSDKKTDKKQVPEKRSDSSDTPAQEGHEVG
jgi:hypothetical protein